MSSGKHLRFDSRKRLLTVNGLPTKLIRKFIIVENRDSRGRVAFHVAFKMTPRSRPNMQVIPKKYRTFQFLIEAELAIFEMVEIHLWQGKQSQFSFIDEEPTYKKIILFVKHIVGIILNK